MTVPEATGKKAASELPIIVIGIIILVALVVVSFAAFYVGTEVGSSSAKVTPDAITVIPAPTPTPTPTPTPVIPQTVVFTVLTTSPSPHYSVTTTTGQVYFCKYYYDWNSLYPQDTYTAIVSDNMLSDITVISHHYGDYYDLDYGNTRRYYDQYPWFYEWNDHYYQYDGHTVDEISWKSMRGQYVRHEKPPYTNYGSANPDRSIAYGSGNPWQ